MNAGGSDTPAGDSSPNTMPMLYGDVTGTNVGCGTSQSSIFAMSERKLRAKGLLSGELHKHNSEREFDLLL